MLILTGIGAIAAPPFAGGFLYPADEPGGYGTGGRTGGCSRTGAAGKSGGEDRLSGEKTEFEHVCQAFLTPCRIPF